MTSSTHILSPFCLSLQCWEYGISLCRELAFQYETLYDYQSLSWIRVSNILCTYLCVLLLSNKPPLWCWKVTFSSLSSSSSSAVWGVCSIKHNVLITCARPHSTGKAHFGPCVIKSLFIVTLLRVYFSVTENGGSVLRQHHRAAKDWTGVLPNGLLRQEVSFLPQGRAKSSLILSVLMQLWICWCDQLLCSFMIQRETTSAPVACVGQSAWSWI